MNKQGVVKLLNKRVVSVGSAYGAAMGMGVSAQYLSDILSGKREPAGRVLVALGLERVITYKAIAK